MQTLCPRYMSVMVLNPDFNDDRSLRYMVTIALQYADPRMPFPCPVLPNAGGMSAMDRLKRDRGPQGQFKFSNLIICPVESFAPQCGEECSRLNAVP